MRPQSNRRGRPPTVDLFQLARQCQGDARLQHELLGQFRLQSRALCAQLSETANEALEARAGAAHKLCGSALAVGAGRVAEAARRVENEIRAALGRPSAKAERLPRAIAALQLRVAEAIAEIERIHGRN